MQLDYTFCTPKYCPEDKRKDCKRWTGNIPKPVGERLISMADFSQDEKGDPVKECEYYMSLGE